MELTPDEQKLARTLDFSEDVLRIVKNELQCPIEPYEMFTSSSDNEQVVISAAEELDGKGFVVRLAEKQLTNTWWPEHEGIVYRLREQLIVQHGYMPFLTEDYTYRPCLGVIKANNEDDVVRLETNYACDFDKKECDAECLVAILQRWRQVCAFDIIGADYNNVKLRFRTLPQDLPAFCKEVNHLCWELQQVYDIDGNTDDSGWLDKASSELSEIIRRENRLLLWWD